MAANFLKQNDDKTEVMEIVIYQNCVNSVKLADVIITPTDNAKHLGFKFDDQLSLIFKLVQWFRNATWISGTITELALNWHSLKVQLVHGGVLFLIDYCNAVYGGLSEEDLQRLQKVQNSAVRFIFGLKLSDHQHIMPYLKQLHFLPVKHRIQYKLCVMVFKCINNMAPTYLTELINMRETKQQAVRLDDDFYVLKRPPAPNFRQTEAAFCLSGPAAWNALPYNIRCQANFQKFKGTLKQYYFNEVFKNVRMNS